MDEFIFRGFDRALFPPLLEHHEDILLRDLIVHILRLDPDQAENRVGGCGENEDQGGKKAGNEAQDSRHEERDALRMDLRKALWHELSEHDREIREKDRDKDDDDRLQDLNVQRHPQALKKSHQREREALRGEGAGEEAGQGDGDLNRGKEAGRLLRQLDKALRPLPALLRKLPKPRLPHLQNRDLRTGKKAVDQDQDYQKQRSPDHELPLLKTQKGRPEMNLSPASFPSSLPLPPRKEGIAQRLYLRNFSFIRLL